MPTSVIVLLSALFGLGAALVFLGLTEGDLVSLVVGAVVVGLGVRMRRQVKQRLTQAAGEANGEVAADQQSAAQETASQQRAPQETASQETGSSGSAGPSGQALSAPDDEPADGEASPVGDDGLVLGDAEPATLAVDGGETTLHGRGWCLRDAASGEVVAPERLVLSRDGAQVVRVITEHPDEELQADELAPGEALALVPQRSRDGRWEGVRVFDDGIDHLVGWLPEEVAAGMGTELRRGGLRARSLYEWRDDAGRRRGLDVVVHRPDAVAGGPGSPGG